jgi:hypothetical protein
VPILLRCQTNKLQIDIKNMVDRFDSRSFLTRNMKWTNSYFSRLKKNNCFRLHGIKFTISRRIYMPWIFFVLIYRYHKFFKKIFVSLYFFPWFFQTGLLTISRGACLCVYFKEIIVCDWLITVFFTLDVVKLSVWQMALIVRWLPSEHVRTLNGG